MRVGLADEQGYPHEGTVDFTDPQVDPNTGTIRTRAILDNADRRFTPGLFARVQLEGARESVALLIDDKAVLTDQDRKYVYVLGPDNKAQRKDVELGRMADGLRIVTAGLTDQDRVIVDGVQKVFMPGMPVNPQTIGEGAPRAQAGAGGRGGIIRRFGESRRDTCLAIDRIRPNEDVPWTSPGFLSTGRSLPPSCRSSSLRPA